MLATHWFRLGACLSVVLAASSTMSGCASSPTYGTDKTAMEQLADDLGQSVSLTGAGPADAFRLSEVPEVAVIPKLAEGVKCARSWRITTDVGSDPEYPDVSARDAAALRELGIRA